MTSRIRRRRLGIAALAVLGLGVGPGCASHRRVPPAPPATGTGVHVRAPFVDVHVPTRVGLDDPEDAFDRD